MLEAISDFAYLAYRFFSWLGLAMIAVMLLTASVFCFLCKEWGFGAALVTAGVALLVHVVWAIVRFATE